MQSLAQAALCVCFFLVVACGDTARASDVSAASLRPDPASGLVVADMRLPDDVLWPSFGGAPGNNRTVMTTLADASPAQIAPVFSRLKAARDAGDVPDDYQIILPVAATDSAGVVQTAAANICTSIGAKAAMTEEKQGQNNQRQVGIRCS